MCKNKKPGYSQSAPDSWKGASNIFTGFELHILPKSGKKGASAHIFNIFLPCVGAILAQQNKQLLHTYLHLTEDKKANLAKT